MKIELSALTSACFMGVLILKLAENLKNKVLGQQKTKKTKFLAEMLSIFCCCHETIKYRSDFDAIGLKRREI